MTAAPLINVRDLRVHFRVMTGALFSRDAVLQLIPPTAGEVVWLGQPIQGLSAAKMRPLRRDMQIVFQDPLAALDPRMTAGEIIGEPLDTFQPSLRKPERAPAWRRRCPVPPPAQ
jgi:ABC-type microcin C transport system duplicated ATPase subunit YejF